MSKRKSFISTALLCLVLLVACIPLPTAPEETVDIPLGPQLSQSEFQTKVFEAAWVQLEKNYVYYESSNLNWNTLHDTYTNKINSGLTNDEFQKLMTEFTNEFPEGDIRYQSRSEKIKNEIINTTEMGGIGVFVSYEEKDIPHIVVLDVIPGSQAEKAGLRPHDSILAIDNEPVKAEEGLSAIDRIRGTIGSTVVLTVQTPGKSKRDVTVKRAQLSGTGSIKSGEIPNTNVGYILIPTSATSSSSNDLVSAVTELTQNTELKGIIIDLRISNATSNWPLQALLTMFENGNIGEVYNRNESQLFSVEGQDISGSQTIPLVILVGENTAGLPEIFAASVQDINRGTIIGSNTSGRMEVLNIFDLPDGSEIFIANTSFRLSKGKSIGSGIQPTVKVDARWDEVTSNNDPVIDAAVQSFEVAP
ncbi:MAG: S41 family peptidase [Anaerolineales bacterium]